MTTGAGLATLPINACIPVTGQRIQAQPQHAMLTGRRYHILQGRTLIAID
ncbi:hypothetical protein [Shewanella sp. GXUN23E]